MRLPDGQIGTGVRSRLTELFAETRLTPVQRRIATHMIENAPEVAFLSSAELAAQVGVSQPSVTRFAVALGFSGYATLLEALREIVLRDGPRPPDAPSGNKMQRAIGHSIGDLRALQESLGDLEPLSLAAARMADSSPLVVYGARSSAALAAHFSYFATKIHPNVWGLSGSASEVRDRIDAARMAGATTMLAVVLPRYPREAIDALRFATAAGIRVTLVTDSALSPLRRFADAVLHAPVNPELVFDAAVAPMQLLAALLEALADVDSAGSRHRLERFEALAKDHDVFFAD